jgi:hypothetical protein
MSKFGSVVSGGGAETSTSELSSRPSMLLGSRLVCGGRGACATEEPELVLCRG